MATIKLRKFTFSHNAKKKVWELTNDDTNKVLQSFPTKQEAIKGGALAQWLGEKGGSVKIKKRNSKYQEERTYPRGADPVKSRG